MAEIGHNSGVAADRLKSFIDRIENLIEDRKAVQEDIKLVFAEAKAEGFNVKTMRRVLQLKAMKPHDRSEQAQLLDVYCAAVGVEDLFL